MTKEEIEAAAAAIREELDMLLTDYAGDELVHADPDEESDPSRRMIAEIRLYAIEWVRELWCSGKGASEERMIGAAKAALEAAASVKHDR
jgi:hypothetical protein